MTLVPGLTVHNGSDRFKIVITQNIVCLGETKQLNFFLVQNRLPFKSL
jgi:hypothetical protein